MVLDSLKDVALDLVKDDVGARVNHALQLALADGVQVVALHHQRKHGTDGSRPTRLADVYGSAWITAGAGSVILLWGEPGDAWVDLTHLKQPAGDVGPLRVFHDHSTGASRIDTGADPLAVLRLSPTSHGSEPWHRCYSKRPTRTATRSSGPDAGSTLWWRKAWPCAWRATRAAWAAEHRRSTSPARRSRRRSRRSRRADHVVHPL